MATTLEQLAPPPGTEAKPKHEDGSIDVIPYFGWADPNADKFLPWFWNRLQQDGLTDLYFPGMGATGFTSFVNLFDAKQVSILLVVKKNPDGTVHDTVGFATLSPMQLGHAIAAQAGFIFLKDYWNHHSSKESANRIMKYWFESPEAKLDIIIGIVAEANILAKRFLMRIGWIHSGNIPLTHQYAGQQSDSSIWYVTREKFEASSAGKQKET